MSEAFELKSAFLLDNDSFNDLLVGPDADFMSATASRLAQTGLQLMAVGEKWPDHDAVRPAKIDPDDIDTLQDTQKVLNAILSLGRAQPLDIAQANLFQQAKAIGFAAIREAEDIMRDSDADNAAATLNAFISHPDNRATLQEQKPGDAELGDLTHSELVKTFFKNFEKSQNLPGSKPSNPKI